MGVAVVAVFATTQAPGNASTIPLTTAVPIVPNTPWTDTGLNFDAGMTLSITASGKINFVGERYYPATPAGTVKCLRLVEKFTAPLLQCYSLIAKIGLNGVPFEVGTSYLNVSVSTGGELYLGPNDNHFPDNRGNWVAVITGGNLTPVTTPPGTTPPAVPPQPPITSPPAVTRAVTPAAPAAPAPAPAPAAPAPVHASTGSGVLAFTGFGPMGQLAVLLGLILVVVGLVLFFVDVRRGVQWLLGL